MHPDTVIALEKSIKKWEFIVQSLKGGTVFGDNYPEGELEEPSCALCVRFTNCCALPNNSETCPVSKLTRLNNCDGTPYIDDWENDVVIAQKELDFLISLRPIKETDNDPSLPVDAPS